MSAEQIKMNCVDEIKIREMVKAFYEQNPGCEIRVVAIQSNQMCRHCENKPILRGESLCRDCFLDDEICKECEEEEEEDTCICGTEPNKNCDQHSCLNCCNPKASFNDVAWMCVPCQKVIDDEVDAYSEDEDKCRCEECDKEIDFDGSYDYDDDTGFYHCGDHMPDYKEYEEDNVCRCEFPKFHICDGLQVCRRCKGVDHYKKGVVTDWSDTDE